MPQVIDNSSHNWRTELPNIIFDLKLTGNQFMVYAYFKRIAGDKGQCYQSNPTICAALGISDKTLRTIKQELSEPRKELNNLALIEVVSRKKDTGSKDTDLITIIDIWDVNFEKHLERKKFQGGPVNITGGVLEKLPEGPVNITDKEEPLKKIPSKKVNDRSMGSMTSSLGETKKTSHVDRLNPEQRAVFDRIMKTKPAWGDSPPEREVTYWLLQMDKTPEQVRDALLYYLQECEKSKAAGRTINNMGAYMRTAIDQGKGPIREHEIKNRQLAEEVAKHNACVEAKAKYVKVVAGAVVLKELYYYMPCDEFHRCLRQSLDAAKDYQDARQPTAV